jgi:hypothetical protein
MTLADPVRNFVARLSPEPACDGCIAGRLEAPDPAAVAIATIELAGSPGFERLKASCSLCGQETYVIRRP